ncbi:unnamed protein product [Rotaria sp. Silwood1]|nr:unnamed protein product [Rotaria sp. Silwood1]CAF1627100.1 unnamed protein product [Rotaria sp. Silwood1]
MASATNQKDQEFATPGTYEELRCKGHPCVNCGKCRDWYYTGDRKSWKWIQDWKNWGANDQQRWIDDSVYDRFKCRDGATCLYGYYYGPGHGVHLHLYPPYPYPAYLVPCLCEDNQRV